jgi:flagellar protein FlbD
MDTVVILTRLNGNAFALNPDLVERAESTPDTVVTLVDGTKYVVRETVEELIEAIRRYRASVVAAAGSFEHEAYYVDDVASVNNVLPLHRDS